MYALLSRHAHAHDSFPAHSTFFGIHSSKVADAFGAANDAKSELNRSPLSPARSAREMESRLLNFPSFIVGWIYVFHSAETPPPPPPPPSTLAASWPHPASMSMPRRTRTVTRTPECRSTVSANRATAASLDPRPAREPVARKAMRQSDGIESDKETASCASS